MSEGVGLASDEQDDGGAAQAFAELRAEVTVMRRALEGLPAIIKTLAPPNSTRRPLGA